jgi:hypothetical protein
VIAQQFVGWVERSETHRLVEFIETVTIAESDRRKSSFGNAKSFYKL